MNLFGLTTAAVGVVNPRQNVQVQLSTGSTTNADGSRTPTYATPIVIPAQVQDLSEQDIRQLDALNIAGSMRSVYFPGFVSSIVRFTQQGGDLITLADGSVWLTTSVLESWPNYTKVTITLQNGS